jgi:hypothetical protein
MGQAQTDRQSPRPSPFAECRAEVHGPIGDAERLEQTEVFLDDAGATPGSGASV